MNTNKKLQLNIETLRALSQEDARQVAGGSWVTTENPRVCDTDTNPSGAFCSVKVC